MQLFYLGDGLLCMGLNGLDSFGYRLSMFPCFRCEQFDFLSDDGEPASGLARPRSLDLTFRASTFV